MNKHFWITALFILILLSGCGGPTATSLAPDGATTPAAPKGLIGTIMPAGAKDPIDPTMPATPGEPIGTLEKETDKVWLLPGGEDYIQVLDNAPVRVGSSIWIEQDGRALLKFTDLWVRLYYNSGLKVNPCIVSVFCLPIQVGTFLGNAKAPYQLTTENAHIMITGTTLMIAYIPDRQLTLVRVFDGQVELTATQGKPQAVQVIAGQWATTEKDKPPVVSDNAEDLRKLTRELGLWDLYAEIEQQVLNNNGLGVDPVDSNTIEQIYYPPDGLSEGVARNGDSYQEITVKNPQACREACQNDPAKCKSFNYIRKQGLCQLFDVEIAGKPDECCTSGVTVPDTEAPKIVSFTSSPDVSSSCVENLSINIASTITDQSGVGSASMVYKYGDNPSEQSVGMTQAGDNFSAVLSNLHTGLLSYYVRAQDTHGNVSVSNTKTTDIYSCAGLDGGEDRPGTAWQTFSMDNPQDCRKSCKDNQQCSTFSYTIANGQCRLMLGEPPARASTCCFSGVVRPDKDAPEITINKTKPAEEAVCIQKNNQLNVGCSITDNSGVASANLVSSFVTYGSGHPWNNRPTVMQAGHSNYSAVRKIPGAGTLTWNVEATDIHGNRKSTANQTINYWDCDGLLFNTDLPNLPLAIFDYQSSPRRVAVNQPEACRQLCKSYPDCYAFTYLPSEGLCWVKSGEPLPAAKTGYVSGIVIKDIEKPSVKVSATIESRRLTVSALAFDQSSVRSMMVKIYKRDYSENSNDNGNSTNSWKWVFISAYCMRLESGDMINGKFIANIVIPCEAGYQIEAVDIHGNTYESTIYENSCPVP